MLRKLICRIVEGASLDDITHHRNEKQPRQIGCLCGATLDEEQCSIKDMQYEKGMRI